MHQASNKALEAAQRMWDATHSLKSAVDAGCEVARADGVREAVKWLRLAELRRNSPERGFQGHAADRLEDALRRGEFGGIQ